MATRATRMAGDGGTAPAADMAAATADLVAMGRGCAERGWVAATSGNFSRRLDANRMAVTASGRDKGALTAGDIVAVALDAPLPAGASAEAPLHVALYRRDPAIGAIAHVHSLAATLISARDAAAGATVLAGYEMLKALAGIRTHESSLRVPVFPNDQDTERLAALVDGRLTGAPGAVGYLIAGHGLYAWGRDMAETRRHLEAFDFLFACDLEKGRLFP